MTPSERDAWAEFRGSGLLWWVNRGLHLFGWCIVIVIERDSELDITSGRIVGAYPARRPFRGFDCEAEVKGFEALTHHLEREMPRLTAEVDDAARTLPCPCPATSRPT
ncbi:MAG: hypothetical protein M9894_16035 [Planctomycetes bacterium]|nr:hypothetical protein [Planctomycetota bacterium]